MKWLLLSWLGLWPMLAVAQAAQSTANQPSVQVTTETPKRGSVPKTVVGYGTMQPAPGDSQTLSLLRAGQVAEVDVHQGEAVRQGQKLIVVNAEPAALANYQQAEAALRLARSERAHTAQLLAQHLATRDQLATVDKAVTDAETALKALDRAGGGSTRQTLTAPFNGIVSNVQATPGARVAAQAPLISVAATDRVVAAVGIEPSQRRLVAVDQSATLELLYDGVASSGKVISVSAVLDPTTRLVMLLVAPSSGAATDSLQLPGAPVRATVRVGEINGWTVPRDSVLIDPKGAYLFQVAAGMAARVEVQVIGHAGGTTIVTGAIDPARGLVTAGNYQLQDGMAVREAHSAPSTGAVTAATIP